MYKQHTKGKRIIYVADFETTLLTSEVNLWSVKNTETKERFYGVSINSFFDFIDTLNDNVLMYFHNGSGFDNHFTLNYMVKNVEKYRIYSKDFGDKLKEYKLMKKNLSRFEYDNNIKINELDMLINMYSKKSWDYEMIINDNHKILSMNITLPNLNQRKTKHKTCIINDSYLLIQSSIKKWGKALKLPKLDYNYQNNEIWKNIKEVPKKELEYLDRDIDILERALEEFAKVIDIKYWGITAAQTAYSDWSVFIYNEAIKNNNIKQKKTLERGKKIYNVSRKKYLATILPVKWLEQECIPGITYYDKVKPYYRGGITQVNSKYKGVIINNIYTYDINSSYPAVMSEKQLPYGEPFVGDGGDDFPFKFYKIFFKNLKSKKFNFIPDKQGYSASKYYNELSEGIIYLTTPEYELFINNYKWDEIEVEVEFSFKTRNDLFKNWDAQYQEIKRIAKLEGNKPVEQASKIPRTSLYGKFGTKIVRLSRQVKLDENGIPLYTEKDGVIYEQVIEDLGSKYYLPLGVAITAYARVNLINYINENYEYFLYCDTDSAHFLKKVTSNMIDEVKLGYWKEEGFWQQGIYRHAKQYMHLNEEYKMFLFNVENSSIDQQDEYFDYLETCFEVKVAGSLQYSKRTPYYISLSDMRDGIKVPLGSFRMERGKNGKVPIYSDFTLKPVWHKDMIDKDTPYQDEKSYKKYVKNLKLPTEKNLKN